MKIFLASLSIISLCFLSEPKDCKPSNFGIKKEIIWLTYPSGDSNSLLYYAETYYNINGLLDSSRYYFEDPKDTIFYHFIYEGDKIISRNEYFLTRGDSAIYTATDWFDNGYAKEFDVYESKERDRASSKRLIEEYEGCNITKRSIYSEEEELYSSDIYYHENLLDSGIQTFHGEFAETMELKRSVFSYEYVLFDRRGYWTERKNFVNGELNSIEKRNLIYH